MAVNDMDNVFKELDEAQAAIHSPPPEQPVAPQPPTPQPLYDPQIVTLQQQVGQLQAVLGQMIQGSQQQAAQPLVDPRLLQEREYFNEADAAALLHGQQPVQQLNKLANRIREDVAQPLIETIQQQQWQLQQYHAAQERARQQEEMARQERANSERFFSTFADLKPYEKLVRIEAQQMAIEAQQNPYIYNGRDPQQLLAERVRGTIQQWGINGQPAQPATSPIGLSPNTRHRSAAPYMEQGSGSRVDAAAMQPKTPNERELAAMSKSMQRQRSR